MKKIFAFAFIVLALSAVSCKKDKKGGSVKPVVVAGVTLDKTTLALMEGETYQLEATVTPDNAVNKNVIWSVDDDNVVSVTDGLVMGLLEGTATITVTTEDGGKTAACVVTVEAEIIPPSAVNILQDEYELEVGDEFDMATHLTVDGPGGVDMSVEWTSTDSEVAVVENNKILAKKAGTANLKAAAVHGDKYDECVVIVYDKPTGVELIRDGVTLREADPVDFEFSEEVTFEVKVLPATARQDKWCLEAADDGDKISDYFEMSDMDTNSPKFKAIKDGTIRINLCYGDDRNVEEYFEFTIGPQLTIDANGYKGGFAGEALALVSNISGVEWSATYLAKQCSVFMGDHPVLGYVNFVANPSSSAITLPLPMFKSKTGAVCDASVTVTAKTAHQTAQYVVTSKAWRPYFMDNDTKQELRVDDVCVGQVFSVGLKDAAGEDILIQDWKDKIVLQMGSGNDAYTFISARSDCYIYQFEEGAGSYKIVLKASIDSSVKYEQDFSPSL